MGFVNEMITDKLSRYFKYLRISITDKCNYRCSYCMPKDIFGKNHQFLRKNELLTYEEIIHVVKILKQFGLKKIRLTGGEPLLRKNIELLIRGLKKDACIEEVAMTTNGSLLNVDKILMLRKHGLDSVTISLDSLSQDSADKINPVNNNIDEVLMAISDVLKYFGTVKINMVVIKNKNDHEVIKILNNFVDKKVELRFIEYMDVGESNNWVSENVFTSNDTMNMIKKYYSVSKLIDMQDSTSEKWKLEGHPCTIAFISSISKPFCSDCNRGRLSADGKFYTCLFTNKGYDFASYLRNNNEKIHLREFFEKVWKQRDDQYSQLRFTKKVLKGKKNKVEMSYIGG